MFLKYEDLNLIACGDIHGDFKTLVFKVNKQYNFRNTIVIVCGDIGMGFNKEGYYGVTFKKLNKDLSSHNNHLIFLRGNHDDSSYFDDQWSYSNIKLVTDYSIVEVGYKTCLLAGGAISIDRSERKKQLRVKSNTGVYWIDEGFKFDADKLSEVEKNYSKQITHVFTHSNCSFNYPFSKDGLSYWITKDSVLLQDIAKDRREHTLLFEYLTSNNHPLKQWTCGHYHCSHREYIENILFTILDICEFTENL